MFNLLCYVLLLLCYVMLIYATLAILYSERIQQHAIGRLIDLTMLEICWQVLPVTGQYDFDRGDGVLMITRYTHHGRW